MRYPFALAAAVSVAACNAIVGFGDLEKTPALVNDEPPAEETDAGKKSKLDAGTGTPDSGDPGPPGCDPNAAFGTPEPLPGPVNSSAGHETAPSLTADELTIVFGRIVGTIDGSILMAKRAGFHQPFGEPTPVPGITNDKQNFAPTMTEDGLILYWSVQEVSGLDISSSKIFTARRGDRSSDFSAPEEFLPSSQLRFSPFVSRDGTELYFSNYMGDTNTQIWRSVRGDLAIFQPAAIVNELKATGANGGVAMTPDGLRIYFASDRGPSEGANDVYTAARADKGAAWENITKVNELSSPGADRPGWISPDGCRLYMGSDRSGEGALYMASKPAK